MSNKRISEDNLEKKDKSKTDIAYVFIRRQDRTRKLLHVKIRRLIEKHSTEDKWIFGNGFSVPILECIKSIEGNSYGNYDDCRVWPIGNASAAVMEMVDSKCEGHSCDTQRWLFLKDRNEPFLLSTGPVLETQALRGIEVNASHEYVFLDKGYDYSTEAEDHPPLHNGTEILRISSGSVEHFTKHFACVLAPSEEELLCRSIIGDVIGVNIKSRIENLIVKTGLARKNLSLGSWTEAGPGEVWWNRKGDLAFQIDSVSEELCGPSRFCSLIGVTKWPSKSIPVQVTLRKREYPNDKDGGPKH